MFSSIRWKFILVYFLLVFIAMVIVGVFIVGRLEEQQIQNVTNNMEQQIETIIESSSYIASDNWNEYKGEIQETLDEWRLGSSETLYVIYDEEIPTIIGTTSKQYLKILGQNALSSKYLDPTLILKAFDGEKEESKLQEMNEDFINKHLAYPVMSEVGKVKGILYMTSNLTDVYNTVNHSKIILTNATVLALGITILLGFLIASSITVPIRDVTKKAEEMAMGDFDQFVEVKSNDEIGQLANMFNYLTFKLKSTIQDMDLERSKLDTIFNYMAEGVIAIDKDRKIIHANHIAMDILGLTQEDIDSNKVLDSENINTINMDYNIRNDEEDDEIVSINSEVYKVKHAPFRNEENDMGGLIIVFQDITREHKLDNMRKEFVANVSHELKTPITTIKSYTETLMENDMDLDISHKFLQVIDTECDRMTRLVRDLLQLSNLDYKKTNWEKTNVSLEKILNDSLLKLDLSFKDKNQMVSLYLDESLPNIMIDKDGIEQVILNILSNANKYTPENGNIDINGFRDNGNVVIKIKDNGFGIAKEDQNRIFERFYRVEKGRSRELGGTGLGLSIAQEIIEAHGGRIFMESELSKGTEVSIILPCHIMECN